MATGSSDLKPVSRIAAPVREQVADMLRRSIVSGELVPGQRVTEREVCDATGASRTSVREALRQLESERLITILPHRGPVVSVIDEDEARSLYETRAALETLLVRTCAARATEAQRRAIEAAADTLGATAASGDPSAVMAATSDLYDRFFDGARNSVVESLLRLLHVRVATLPTTLTLSGRLDRVVGQLRDVARAVVEGDADRAQDLTTAHVTESGELGIMLLRPSSVSRR